MKKIFNLLLLLIFTTDVFAQYQIEIAAGQTSKMTFNYGEIQVHSFSDPTLHLNPLGGNIEIGNSIFYNSGQKRLGINHEAPQSRLHIGGSIDASLTSNGLLMLGHGTHHENLIFDVNEIMARNNGSPSTLSFNRFGGNVQFFGNGNGSFIVHGLTTGDFANMQYNTTTGRFYYDSSTRKHKENITALQDDWTKILQVKPVTYTRPGDSGRWEYGYIAEEIDSIGLTTMIGYDGDGNPEDVRYDKMIIYLVEMIKIQQEQIKMQQQEINKFKEHLPLRSRKKF